MGTAERDQACSTWDKETWRSCLCWVCVWGGGWGESLWRLWDSKMWFQTNTLINSHVEFSTY